MQQREEFDTFSTEQIHLCTHFFSIIQKTKSNAHEESVDDYSLFIKDIVVIIERVRYFEYGLTPVFADSLYSYLSFYGKSGNTFFYARMCADLIREYMRIKESREEINAPIPDDMYVIGEFDPECPIFLQDTKGKVYEFVWDYKYSKPKKIADSFLNILRNDLCIALCKIFNPASDIVLAGS